jgi:DNA-directed RNA polymerase alpha subunit
MVRPSRASIKRPALFRGAASRLQRALCNLDKMAPASRPAAIDVSQSKNQYELNFSLTGTDVSVANAIRRTMIAEVPTMAIELVTVKENTSALHDEYIAHRLGLIPLVSTRADEFQFARDCGCEDHCPKCSVVFVLNEMFGNDGDSSVEGDTMIVNSKHLKNMYDSKELCETVVPVHSSGDFEQASTGADGQVFGITITKLARGQKIHMEMIARKGIGKEHAKWSPMCTVSYQRDILSAARNEAGDCRGIRGPALIGWRGSFGVREAVLGRTDRGDSGYRSVRLAGCHRVGLFCGGRH